MSWFGIKTLAGAAVALALSMTNARALEAMTLQLNWKPQADFGGFYNAVANGYYSDCGLDLKLRVGGPGIDTSQLLVAGAVDAVVSTHIDAVLHMNSAGFPARAVTAAFQRFHSILMTHAGSGVEKMEDMRGKPISISQGNRATWWAFLRAKFGFEDSQLRTYTGQLAPWFLDKMGITQGVITVEPFVVEKETGEKPKVFLLADYGYTTYSILTVVPQKTIDERPKAVRCLVEASNKGWADFVRDPKPTFAILQKENPENTPDLMAYNVEAQRRYNIIETDETAKLGVGAMTDARWKAHFEFLVQAGIFKPEFDYKQAYTLRFLQHDKSN
jgi:NitT/TauT family transport system substrate-binding protein